MKDTVIAWVRHGETEWNRLRKLQGQRDIPLNDTGKKQADAVAIRLAEERWDAIYCSDLSRAVETAARIAHRTGLQLQTPDPRIRERDFGSEEGANYGKTRREQLITAKPGSEHPGGIEGDDRLLARGLAFVDDVLTEMAGKKVIVVSHGGFIRRVLTSLTQQPADPMPNCAVRVIRLTEPPNGWVYENWNV